MANAAKTDALTRRSDLRLGLSLFRFGNDCGSLARYGRRYRWTLPAVTALGVLATLLEGASIGLLAPLFAAMGGTGSNGEAGGLVNTFMALFDTVDEPWHLWVLAGLILLLLALKGTLQVAYVTLSAWVDGRIGQALRVAIAERLMHSDYTFLLENDEARISNIITHATWRVSEAVRKTFDLCIAATAMGVFGVYLLALEWRLLVIVGLGIMAARLLETMFNRPMHAISREIASRNRDLLDRTILLTRGNRTIRIDGQEAPELDKIRDLSEHLRKPILRVERMGAIVIPRLELLFAAVFILVLVVGHALGIEFTTIMTFLIMLYRAQPNVLKLNQARHGLASLRGYIEEVEWLFNATEQAPPTAATRGAAAEPVALNLQIRFENVSYRYPRAASAALHEVDFTLEHGRATALIGRSGSGKTSIVLLLTRLVEPGGGRILMGSRPAAEIAPEAWRQRIAVADQNTFLTAGTVRQNIAYGCPHASEERIRAVAAMADLDGFVASLPQGYDTPLGADGIDPSSGQRQRIGLARALLREPDLLILDEATNAIDQMSEQTLLNVIAARRGQGSTLVISHHASILSACEDGIVMQAGRVVETGPLTELGYYAAMERKPAP